MFGEGRNRERNSSFNIWAYVDLTLDSAGIQEGNWVLSYKSGLDCQEDWPLQNYLDTNM
jgi:hypothetical protein